MVKTLSIRDMTKMMLLVCDSIVESESYLTQIDQKIGDGDHGFGMKRGFSHLRQSLLQDNSFNTINDFMRFCGIELLKSMGGASGVIFGTMFIGGLKRTAPVAEADTAFFADFFGASLEAIKSRGRAERGNKTMVDALAPATEALMIAAREGKSVAEAFAMAEVAANTGMESTKCMIAKFGRARQFADQTLGIQDPGATSVYIIFKGMSEWITKINNGEANRF